MSGNVKNKDYKNSCLYTYAVAFIGGTAIRIIYPPFSIIGLLLEYYSIVSMGYSAWFWSPFDKIFRNLNLCQDGAYPILRHKKKTDVSVIYCFSIPCGLCLKDFEDNSDRIKTYVGKDIDFKQTYKEIGIEVFNEKMKAVYEYVPTLIKGDAPIMIGYDRKGELISCDLSKGEPHMLIAGETGSGKSTVLRSIITNLILKSDVILHLVDLKNGAEFGIFRNSSRVKTFCRNKNEARNLLAAICEEVDRRYDVFYKNNVIDAKEYNKKFKNSRLDVQIVIIDEFADFQKDDDSKALIQYIAQKSRGCLIYIILATQRSSAKILDGDIKANITSILGLKTMNKLNSQIIIDDNSLADLEGNGHGILKRGGKTIELRAPLLEADRARELIKHTNIEPNYPTTKKEVELSENDIASIFESFETL
jgi:S-DNA-T family DNA segregation ATPase FtsK/SpoIIIE